MLLEDVLREKSILQKEINDFIQSKINSFQKLTSLSPQIELRYIDSFTISDSRPSRIFTGCDVIIEIGVWKEFYENSD